MSGEPILTSLRYYDSIRSQAQNITRDEESNVDIIETPEGEKIALCHLSSIFSFTRGDFAPAEGSFEEAVSVALAAHHLNTGDGSLIPDVNGLDARCKVRFTTEFSDTEFEAGVALGHVVEQTNRDRGGPERLPCAYLGAYRSAVSMPTSLVTGLLGYPQLSAGSTSADLDDKSQFPLFGRTIPSDAGNAIPIAIYLRKVLNIKHLAVINVNDAYGNAYVDGMRAAARIHAPDMLIHQIPLDEDQGSEEAAISSLKSTGYRFVFTIVFTQSTHDALLTEAYNQGVAGDGFHNWLFGDSFAGILGDRMFEKDSALHLSYRGVGLLEVSGGVPGVPSYENFLSKLQELRNEEDMEYLGSLWPRHDEPNYGDEPPFVNTDDFLSGPLKSGYVPFAYEAAIAIGLAACEASNLNDDGGLGFDGKTHFDLIASNSFESVSGQVILDSITGTRDPSSALYKVANFVEEEVQDWTGKTMIKFKPINTDIFLNGKWDNVADFVFNDGTSVLPPDLAPPIEEIVSEDDAKLGLIIGLPVAILFGTAILLFLFYENKRKDNDAVWKVKQDDLKFVDPPEVIGRGTFGVVLLAEYRGTQVAVKRVIPPKKAGRKHASGGSSLMEDSAEGTGSCSLSDHAVPSEGMSSGMNTSGYHSGAISRGTASGIGLASMAAGTKSIIGRQSQAAVHRKLRQEFVEEMRYLSKLRHPCVTTVMGAVISKTSEPMLIMEYMHHGSLHDLLHNETMAIEGELLLPILRDISQGVRFLHLADPQVIHGDLKAQNILVDNKFRAKVADFGLSQKKNLGGTGTPFWMAPELLRGESLNTAATDVYSFGIILYEVYSRRDPYEGETAEDVLQQVADRHIQKRPPTPLTMPVHIKSLMRVRIRRIGKINYPTFPRSNNQN